jgi:hypothetical protein
MSKKSKYAKLALLALVLVAFSGDPSDLIISLPLLNLLGWNAYLALVFVIALIYWVLSGKNGK